jgi:hypothetical protein
VQSNQEQLVVNLKSLSQPPDPNFTAIFLFVNPTSGGNQAGVFMKLNVKHIIFQFDPRTVDVYFINLKSQENKLFGLSTLKEYQEKGGRSELVA